MIIDRRYTEVRNDGGKELQFPNLLESLRGLKNRLGRLPGLGHGPEKWPLSRVLLENRLRSKAA